MSAIRPEPPVLPPAPPMPAVPPAAVLPAWPPAAGNSSKLLMSEHPANATTAMAPLSTPPHRRRHRMSTLVIEYSSSGMGRVEKTETGAAPGRCPYMMVEIEPIRCILPLTDALTLEVLQAPDVVGVFLRLDGELLWELDVAGEA